MSHEGHRRGAGNQSQGHGPDGMRLQGYMVEDQKDDPEGENGSHGTEFGPDLQRRIMRVAYGQHAPLLGRHFLSDRRLGHMRAHIEASAQKWLLAHGRSKA